MRSSRRRAKKISTGAGDPGVPPPQAPQGLIDSIQSGPGLPGPVEAITRGAKDLGRLVRQNPANVGGAIGGYAGAPFGPQASAAMAGLLGGAGEGVKILDEAITGGGTGPRRISPTMEGDVERMATAGALQGGTDLGFGYAAQGVKSAAPWLYGKLLNIPDNLAKSFGADNIINTGLEEGIALTKSGIEKATGLVSGSRKAAMDSGQGGAGYRPAHPCPRGGARRRLRRRAERPPDPRPDRAEVQGWRGQ